MRRLCPLSTYRRKMIRCIRVFDKDNWTRGDGDDIINQPAQGWEILPASDSSQGEPICTELVMTSIRVTLACDSVFWNRSER